MNNTSKNMLLKRILAFALSFVMVVTSTPVAPLAYAEQDLNIDTAPVVISDDDLVQLDAENPTSDPAADDAAVTDPAAPAAEQDAPSQEAAAPEEELTLDQAPEVAADAAAMAAGPARVAPSGLQNNTADQTVTSNGKKDLKYSDGKGHTLTVDAGVTLTTQIVVSNGSKLTIKGSGTLKGYKGSVIIVEGQNSKLTLDGPTITGGSGSKLNHTKALGSDGYATCGGGILVRLDEAQGKLVQASQYGKWDGNTGATLEFKSGTVNGNAAEAGGGIFIDRSCGFTMNGTSTTAIVSNNTATKSEGGGIYIAGHKDAGNLNGATKILGGKIDGNTTKTTFSWGGGGIFIESMGVLWLETARVTNNHAEGLGGGIAGCPHAEMGIGSVGNGFAIYDNTAAWKGGKLNSAGSPTNDFLKACGDSSATVAPYFGDMYFYGLNNKLHESAQAGAYASRSFKKEYGQDYYCTKASYVTGMDLDGDSTKAAWIGYLAGPNDKSGHEVTIAKGQSYGYNGSLALTSTYTGSEIASNVVIENNTSYTHGGGIGSNGEVQMGTLPKDEIKNPISFKINKRVTTQWGTNYPEQIKAGQFEFKLYDKNKNYIATASNDKDGYVHFQVSSKQYGSYPVQKDANWVFYVQEVSNNSDNPNVWTNDNALHRVVVPIASVETSSFTIGNKTTTYISPKVSADGVKLYKDETNKELISAVTNVYNVETSAQLGVTKTASGLPAGNYSFELHEMYEASIEDKDVKNLIDTITVSVGDSSSDNQTVKQLFTKMIYTTDGTHWYRIREKSGSDTTVTVYDTSVYLVKVNVTKSSDNKSLVAQVVEVYKADPSKGPLLDLVDNTQSPTFTNTNYLYEGFDFSIAKMLENDLENQFRPQNGEFAFELFDNPDCSGEPLAIAKNNASGQVEFKVEDQDYLKTELKGMKPGALIYTTLYFREVEGSVPGVTYDKGIHSISLELTVTQGTKSDMGIAKPVIGATAKVTMVDWKEVPTSGFTFINKIKVADAQVPFSATKRYNGNTTDKSGAFKFTFEALDSQKAAEGVYEARKGDALVADSAGKLVDNGTGVIKIEAANGDFAGSLAPVSFGDITYTKESYDACKTYWYKVTENFLDNSSAISYDPTVYVAKVELTAANREIVPTVTYYRMTSSVDGKLDIAEIANTDDPMVFHNTDDAYLSMSFNIKKLFKNSLNNDLKIEDEKFTFQLTDAQGDLVSESTANAEGLVTFEIPGKNYIDKSLGDARDYEFTVTEVDPNNDKISFDQKTHKVVLTVKTEAERVVNSENAANNDKTFYKPVITKQT